MLIQVYDANSNKLGKHEVSIVSDAVGLESGRFVRFVHKLPNDPDCYEFTSSGKTYFARIK